MIYTRNATHHVLCHPAATDARCGSTIVFQIEGDSADVMGVRDVNHVLDETMSADEARTLYKQLRAEAWKVGEGTVDQGFIDGLQEVMDWARELGPSFPQSRP